MRPADIAALVTPGDPRVSPDGRQVAFTVTTIDLAGNEYRGQIWLSPTDGSATPRPFSRGGTARDSTPRWDPEGSRLAFVRHEGTWQVVVAPVGAGGEPAVAAEWPDQIVEVAWSPDGRRLALLVRGGASTGAVRDRDRPPRRITRMISRRDDVGWTMDRPLHVVVVDAAGGGVPVVVDGPGDPGSDTSGVSWSPDGTQLAWCRPVADDWDVRLTRALIVAPAPGRPGRPLVLGEGIRVGRPSFSPDGQAIACLLTEDSDAPRNAQIAVFDPAGDSCPRVLSAALDRNNKPHGPGAREPVWDGDHVWWMAEDRGAVHVYRVRVGEPAVPERMVEGDLVVTGFDVAGGTVVYTATTATSTGELWVLDRGTGAPRCLTDLGGGFGAAVDLGEPQHFTVATAAGEHVDAWYLAPTGPDRGATLLNIHGGPFAQYTVGFFDEFAIQAGAGYGVVWCNPRGSSGRAESWGRAIRGPKCAVDPGSGWGGVDADDVLAVLDAAIARFGRDPGRVGVLGGSYGGFMTSWLVGHTDRFVAACSERAVNNQLTMLWTSDLGVAFQLGYVGPSHLEDPEEYLRLSPITYAAAIATPMLILHSDGDLRCPVSQAEELWMALRLMGREVEFVRFPDASHELSRSGPPRQRVWRSEAILEFFGRHL